MVTLQRNISDVICLLIKGYCFLIYLSCLSCSKLISDEFPPFEPLPSVNGILVAGNWVNVHVSQVEMIEDSRLTYINDAQIILFEDGIELAEMPLYEYGLYYSFVPVRAGKVYSCSIRIDGHLPLFCADTIPSRAAVTITDHTSTARINEEGGYQEAITIEFQDDPDADDYYEVIIEKRDPPSSFSKGSYSVYAFDETSEILLNEGLEPYTTESLVFSDQMMEGSTISMSLDFEGANSKNCYSRDSCVFKDYEHTVIVELRHVSHAYYRFKKDFYFYEKNLYPQFTEGTASAFSIYSNIKNGLGIFAAYSVSVDSIWVPDVRIPAK